jgi:uncharacterized membrane protein YesL
MILMSKIGAILILALYAVIINYSINEQQQHWLEKYSEKKAITLTILYIIASIATLLVACKYMVNFFNNLGQ